MSVFVGVGPWPMTTLAGLSYGVSAVNENRDTESLKRFVKPFLNALSESFLRTGREVCSDAGLVA